jgi:nanoRNase/pAp phosphatase (c-di-AMP/oligoRNAs hydrolase)
MGELLGGVGGGHAMAAGVSGTGEIEPTLKQFLRLLKSAIKNAQNTGNKLSSTIDQNSDNINL